MIITRGAAVVSYTHLDVYKRQGRGCADFMDMKLDSPAKKKRYFKNTILGKQILRPVKGCSVRDETTTYGKT